MFVKVTGDVYDNDNPADYSPMHFYTLEVGRENIHVKLGDTSARTISRLVNDDRFVHYQTKADFIRDAVVHRLHFLVENVLNDPKLTQQLEREFRQERLFISIGKLEQARVTIEKAGDQFCTIMRDRMGKGQPLDPDERDILDGFWKGSAGNLPPDLFAEFTMLRLYFIPHPDEFPDWYDPGLEDEEWHRDWQSRCAFWDKGDHTYVTQITRETANGFIDFDQQYHDAQKRAAEAKKSV